MADAQTRREITVALVAILRHGKWESRNRLIDLWSNPISKVIARETLDTLYYAGILRRETSSDGFRDEVFQWI